MKVILFMVMSVNGIIADKEGNEDFLSDENLITSKAIAKECGCVIWGRKTYEIIKSWTDDYLNELKDVTKIIVSSDPSFELVDGFIKVNSPKEALDKVGKLGINKVMVSGGSKINASFMKENLIDEIILNIDSVVVGEGVPLFGPADFEYKLKLLETKKLSEQVVQLHYKIIK